MVQPRLSLQARQFGASSPCISPTFDLSTTPCHDCATSQYEQSFALLGSLPSVIQLTSAPANSVCFKKPLPKASDSLGESVLTQFPSGRAISTPFRTILHRFIASKVEHIRLTLVNAADPLGSYFSIRPFSVHNGAACCCCISSLSSHHAYTSDEIGKIMEQT